MRLYYYHTRPIIPALEEWRNRKHPGHILYGLTHFHKYGVETVIHPYKNIKSRCLLMLHTLFVVLKNRERYDILYGTSYRGLELLIFLRAIGIYKKPIAIWHHQSIPKSKNLLKNLVSKFFYKGIDEMFFFSNALIEKSLKSNKVEPGKLHLIHWGADLDFYNSILEKEKENKDYFISTGKECRDFSTLLKAFSLTDSELQLYAPYRNGDIHYDEIFNEYETYPNIKLNIVEGIIPYELALEVVKSKVVVISCLDLTYTVGLTTLVEAFALGKPIISTYNPMFEVDIEKEGAGIYVGYKDIDSWRKAIEYMKENPYELKKMSINSRRLANDLYNLENYTKELVDVFRSLLK